VVPHLPAGSTPGEPVAWLRYAAGIAGAVLVWLLGQAVRWRRASKGSTAES
jgi:hypothetical protein